MTLPSIPTYIRTRSKPAVNPLDYGLIADGSAHALSTRYATLADAQADYPFVTSLTQQIDWAACKLAANIAFGEDGLEHASANATANRRLLFPAGNFWFGNDTLLIRNLVGGVIEGEGELSTVIRGNATILAFDGIWYTTIRDMSLQCQSSTAIAAMELDGNVPGHPYATRGVQGVLLESLLIDGGDSTYALAMCRQGGGGAQGSECVLTKLHLQRGAFACYYQNGFNALANQFIGGNIQSYPKNGIYVVGGTISVYGTGFQSTKGYAQIENDGWDINVGDAGAYEGIPIIGCRTESLRFLRNAGGVKTFVAACVGNVAVPSWSANTAYGPVASQGKAIIAIGRLFVATTAGVSGATEPTWPTNGSTINDGTVVWQEESFDVISMPDGSFAGSVDFSSCSFSAGRITARSIDAHKTTWSQAAAVNVEGESLILADATSHAIAVALPPSPRRTQRVTVKKVDASANAVTVTGPGVNFEGGSSSVVIPGGARGWREFVYYDGEAGVRRWQIIGSG